MSSQQNHNLNERGASVLKEIVELYTHTGQPVGSKSLVDKLPTPLSSASIRNAMAELEDKGLLISPHTSAGRIPTEHGLRYYVGGILQTGDVEKDIQAHLKQSLSGADSFQKALENINKALSQVTACAGLVLAPKTDTAQLANMQFVRLGGERVLVVIELKNGEVENRIINVPTGIKEESLKDAESQLNKQIAGMTLADAHNQILRALHAQKDEITHAVDELTSMQENVDSTDALIVGGRQNLFGYPELVREHLQDLFKAFEEKRLLAGLLDRVQRSDGVQIFIGSDCPLQVAKDCSMITASYGTADKKVLGTIGVIGPMRMDYRRNIALIDYTAKLLSKTLEEVRT